MTEKQAKAREFIDDSLTDALRALDDVGELLPHAGYPKSPKLDAELAKARESLANAQRIVGDLAEDG